MHSKPSAQLSEQNNAIVDLEERSWLARHARGDDKAFAQLLAAYQRPVFSYLVRCGVATAYRDDLLQDIFLKIHAAADTYRSSHALRPWLFTIVANTVRNHFRSQNPSSIDIDEYDIADQEQASPDHIVAAQHTLGWLQQAIAQLPLKQREVLLLTTVEGLRQQDVADILSLPLNSVKTYLRRARLTLIAGMAQREQTTRACDD